MEHIELTQFEALVLWNLVIQNRNQYGDSEEGEALDRIAEKLEKSSKSEELENDKRKTG